MTPPIQPSQLQRIQTPAFWGIVTFVLLALAYLRLVINFNAPYLDECDYIFVGRALLSGEPWITKTYMFSSDMHLYIYGLADRIFSGELSYLAARACAVLMGCASLWFFYGFVRHLYGKHVDSHRIAEISTLLLALTVPHVFISQFATYDIVCFMFFAASLWMLAASVLNPDDTAPQQQALKQQALKQQALKQQTTKQQTTKQQTLMMCAGAVLFALAVLAKYVVIAYAPLLFLALLMRNRRAALLFILIVSAMLGGYVFFYRAELLQLYQNQILGTHKSNATVWKIIATALEYCGFTALLAGGIFLFKKEKVLSTWFYGALALFAVPLVAYHLRSQDVISLYKHIIYTCCFLAPIAGETLYVLLRRAADHDNDWLRALAAALVVFACGLLAWQLRAVQTAYPNTDTVTHLVRKSMTAEMTILSEDAYLFRYACFPTIPTKNLEEMTWFDNNHDGKHEAQDVIDAVWDGKFEYVYLNGLILRELGDELRRGVLQRHYDCILTIPFTNSTVMSPINTGSLSLYRRRAQ